MKSLSLIKKMAYGAAVLAAAMSVGCSKSKGGGGAVATTPTTSGDCLTPGSCTIGQSYGAGVLLVQNAQGNVVLDYGPSMQMNANIFAVNGTANTNQQQGYYQQGIPYHNGLINMNGTLQVGYQNNCGQCGYTQQQYQQPQYGYGYCPAIEYGSYTISTVTQGQWSSYSNNGGFQYNTSTSGRFGNIVIRATNSAGKYFDMQIIDAIAGISNSGGYNYYPMGYIQATGIVSNVDGTACQMFFDIQ